MVLVKLDISKTIEENANKYFEAAKKARRKLKGLEVAKKTVKLKEKEEPKKQARKVRRKQFWFEKFRWFISSDGFLCIGGRDATTNELVIKKHTEADDLVLHTDMAGSPFIVIKAEGKTIPETTIDEAAIFTASNSRAWKNGLGVLDVFYVKPEQVSKDANAGESLARGAFMIRGQTNYKHPKLGLVASKKEWEGQEIVMVSPKTAAKEPQVIIEQGDGKVSEAAKKIQKKLETKEDLDIIIRALPPGNVKVK